MNVDGNVSKANAAHVVVSSLRPLPIATIGVVLITAILTSLEFFSPAVLKTLERDPVAFTTGQWWRIITPLFVRDGIWFQYVLLVLVAIVGVPVERRFGMANWLVLYFVPGMAGELAGMTWGPIGASAAHGLFGLAGAWLALLLWRESDRQPVIILFALCTIAGMVGYVLGAVVGAVVLGALAGLPLGIIIQSRDQLRRFAPFLGGAGLLGAMILVALRDFHGPPFVVGAFLAGLILWRERARLLSGKNSI